MHIGARTFFKYAIPALVVYVVLLCGLFIAMFQPPAVFGRIMSKLPAVAYLLFPFKSMWLIARRGRLRVGDAAPDFALQSADRSQVVRLSAFRGREPVVLIFGSHT